MDGQTQALRSGVEVLVATHRAGCSITCSRRTPRSGQVEVVVLDEADRMLDMGFLPDISRILNLLPRERQSLMFSATFSDDIRKLAASFLRDPVLVEVARPNMTADNVRQELMHVHESEKQAALLTLLHDPELPQALVFVNTKIGARRLARELQRTGVNADAIHGDKTQEERMKALEAFKNGSLRVLVATDVAARGLDITELPAVITTTCRFAPEDYIHRIGRTARAGAQGRAITNCDRGRRQGGDRDREADHQRTIEKSGVQPRAGARRARKDEGRERPGRRAPRSPAQAPVDEFFLKPYEPSPASHAAEPSAPRAGQAIHQSSGSSVAGRKALGRDRRAQRFLARHLHHGDTCTAPRPRPRVETLPR